MSVFQACAAGCQVGLFRLRLDHPPTNDIKPQTQRYRPLHYASHHQYVLTTPRCCASRQVVQTSYADP